MGYYDTIAAGYEELHEAEQLKKIKLIDEHANIHGLILDVGAGTCLAAKYFLKQGKQVVSVDPSESLLAQGIGATIVGKAEKIPFKDGTFDTVISVTALHHADIGKALQDIKRVAKDDATIALSFLKQSPKLKQFAETFTKIFGKPIVIDEGKDMLYIKQ